MAEGSGSSAPMHRVLLLACGVLLLLSAGEPALDRAGDVVLRRARFAEAIAAGLQDAYFAAVVLPEQVLAQPELLADFRGAEAEAMIGRIEAAALERARRKPTEDLAAYDLVLRGMERFDSVDEAKKTLS